MNTASIRLVLLTLLCLISSGIAGDNNLNLYIWSEYIDPQVIKDFEEESECKVRVDLYEDAESMLAKIQAGGVSLYDVVVPPDHIVPAMLKLGLLAPLRHERIPNLANLDPKFANPSYDPGNKYTVAYQWGTLGILVRNSAGQEIPKTWGVFFDPKLQPGAFVLMDSVRDLIGAALKYQGHSLNSVQPNELKAARDTLLSAKRRCLGFDGSVGGKNKVLARSARAAIVYSGEGVRAVLEDTELRYFIPREGSQIWVDNAAIPAKAPHRDLAEQFINFLLDAKVGAQISKYTRYATPNRAARRLLPKEDLENPAIYPPSGISDKLEFLSDLGAKTRLYDEVWTQVKAK